MDGIAFGFFAAILANKLGRKYTAGSEASNRAFVLLRYCGVGALLFFFFLRHYVFSSAIYRSGLDVTVLEISTAILLMGLAERKELHSNPLLAALKTPLRPLQWLGRYSYETYLSHSFVVIWLSQVFDAGRFPFHSVLGLYVVVICLSAAVGFLLSRYYSEPLNRKIRARTFEWK